MICRTLILELISVFTLLGAASSAGAQPQRAVNSWLDRPLVNWNRPGSTLPRPSAAFDRSELSGPCRNQVRQPTSAAERAVVRMGWTLYGPVQSYESTTVFRVMAGVGGMCRPMGHQAFVYSGGRYAGTLSPTAMEARSDGSLTSIYLTSPTSISAEFARYRESDPLCCPSRTTSVNYTLRNTGNPVVAAVEVSTLSPCPESEPPDGNAGDAASLFGRRWALTGIGDQRLSAGKPYIEFDDQQRRASGDGGCNRFSGGFELNGTSLKLTRMISTKRACLAPEANRLETNFLQALEQTTRFRIEGTTLRLYAGDRQLLTFSSN